MKVVIDDELCEANAVCMDVCPECFRVEEDDTLTVLVERPPERLREQVEQAVWFCPRQARSPGRTTELPSPRPGGSMRADRRGFLRGLGGALASVFFWPLEGRTQELALRVHRATRNTLRGAIGAAFARLRPRPPTFKPVPTASRVALPRASGEGAAPARPLAAVVRDGPAARAFADAPLTPAELGRLLALTNGVTGRRGRLLLRAAPSAGALYAGEVYVVAVRVDGLAPGVYRYEVRDHSLVRTRGGALAREVEASVESPHELSGAAAFVLLTNVFARYTWKYANRGYRYALIDSGHIGENLRLAARAAGLGERALLRFHDDRLNALLRVDGREEAVCALHAVGREGKGAGAPQGPPRRLAPKGERRDAQLEGNDFERYHEATKLAPAEPAGRDDTRGGNAPLAAAGHEAGKDPGASAGVGSGSETSGAAAEGSVDGLIRARRSPLGFRRQPIGRADLAFVLELAAGHAWLERAPGVEVHVVAHRVDGVEPGLYRYRGLRRGLEGVRSGELGPDMVRACLGQEMAGSAAAGLAMVGHITREATRAGDRSYRDLLLECGAIGQRVYLAAGARGLAARNLAAFFDEDLNRFLGVDGERRAVLHLTMLGHPA